MHFVLLSSIDVITYIDWNPKKTLDVERIFLYETF